MSREGERPWTKAQIAEVLASLHTVCEQAAYHDDDETWRKAMLLRNDFWAFARKNGVQDASFLRPLEVKRE